MFSPNAAGATDERRGQVIGMRVDPARGVLWAATLVLDTAAPPFQRGPGGWASLRAFDLRSGRLVASHAPDSTSAHLLNDIALAANGDVYVTGARGMPSTDFRAAATPSSSCTADRLGSPIRTA
jgi:hypothetical protein